MPETEIYNFGGLFVLFVWRCGVRRDFVPRGFSSFSLLVFFLSSSSFTHTTPLSRGKLTSHVEANSAAGSVSARPMLTIARRSQLSHPLRINCR
ncbi:hypothetical protein BDV59DRAFT_26127 [Aspergillus ambiguus]|uniref:uncharacterized protein n=1 Tax=Aspergillus ambiguus TaxID=176160 RepID=UPI003CCCDFB0